VQIRPPRVGDLNKAGVLAGSPVAAVGLGGREPGARKISRVQMCFEIRARALSPKVFSSLS